MDTGVYNPLYNTLSSGVIKTRGVSAAADFVSLLKPRVVLLHLLTATAAMFLAAKGLPAIHTLVLVLLGGGLSAGAANAFNCYFDRELDKNMARTRERPLPSGRLTPRVALVLGVICAISGLSLLSWINLAAGALALAALVCYVFAYTLWLKRKTAFSAILSSGIGAVPPLVGWISVRGDLSLIPLLLFAVIALWTPPHFWALALSRGDEYKQAGLSVTPDEPARWIILFLLLSAIASVALTIVAHLKTVYSTGVAVMAAGYIAVWLKSIPNGKTARMRRLYLYSISYLILFFATIILGSIFG